MVQTKTDFITGGVVAVVAVIMFAMTFSFKEFAGATVGVGVEFMPRVIAVLMFITAGAIFINAIRNRGKQLKVVDGETGLEVEEEDTNSKNYKKLAKSLGIMIVYALLTQFIGFLLASILYLITQMFILSDSNKKKLILFGIVSIAISVIVYFIFRNVFYVMLPQGILG